MFNCLILILEIYPTIHDNPGVDENVSKLKFQWLLYIDENIRII